MYRLQSMCMDLKMFNQNQSLMCRMFHAKRLPPNLKTREDFKSLLIPNEMNSKENESLKDLRKITEKHSSINDIAAMTRAYKRGDKIQWKGITDSYNDNAKNWQKYDNDDDDDEEVVRGTLGRYIPKSQIERRKEKLMKNKEEIKNNKSQKIKTQSMKNRGQSDRSERNEDPDQEILKYILRQNQPPYIFSPNGDHRHEIDLFVAKLRQRIKKVKRDGRSFSGLGISKPLVKRLNARNITKPSQVQIESIPEILRNRNAIIESSTGSGKTLAFLLPLIENLPPKNCSSIIIAPTRELVNQIYREVISCGVEIRSVSRHFSGIDDEEKDKKIENALRDSKLLIATPKRLLEIVLEHGEYFSRVKHVVVDEVDKLLPKKLSGRHKNAKKIKPTQKLLEILGNNKRNVQFVATSATISASLVDDLRFIGFGPNPNVVKLVPDSYRHGKVPENVEHFYMVVQKTQDNSSYARIISRLFENSGEKSVLVLIHRNESVDSYINEFKAYGLTPRALYKELKIPKPDHFDNFFEQYERGDINIVVSTEETVRGMNFPFLTEIYLTFVPDSPERYVHVAGRVGRRKQPSKVITLIDEEDRERQTKQLKRRLDVLKLKGSKLVVKT